MLDFRMDTFLTVCETMNFTRAAERLRLTQPAVSQHIHLLEEYYGLKLFTYRGKQLTLTPAGALLQNAMRTMRHDETYLMREMQAAEKDLPLCFGATLTVAEFALPDLLADYIQRHPERDVRVTVSNTQDLLNGLDHGTLDFALVEGYVPNGDYACQLYSQEPYIAVCAPEYPVPTGACRMEDLLASRLLLRESGSGTRSILERYLDARGLSAQAFAGRLEVGSLGAIKKLAARGCGITFLYERAVGEELTAGSLRKIELQDLKIVHDFAFIWRRGSIFQKEYEAVFQELCGPWELQPKAGAAPKG